MTTDRQKATKIERDEALKRERLPFLMEALLAVLTTEIQPYRGVEEGGLNWIAVDRVGVWKLRVSVYQGDADAMLRDLARWEPELREELLRLGYPVVMTRGQGVRLASHEVVRQSLVKRAKWLERDTTAYNVEAALINGKEPHNPVSFRELRLVEIAPIAEPVGG